MSPFLTTEEVHENYPVHTRLMKFTIRAYVRRDVGIHVHTDNRNKMSLSVTLDHSNS